MEVVRRSLTATVCMLALSSSISAAPSKADIAAMIKADVAEIVAGINAHDPDRTTKFDAADVIGIEAFNAPIIGAKADTAVYRSTYHEDSTAADGTPMTHKVSFLAGFKHDADGAWRVHWYVVCAQERSHKK
jgi:hypothetical protein